MEAICSSSKHTNLLNKKFKKLINTRYDLLTDSLKKSEAEDLTNDFTHVTEWVLSEIK